MDKTCIICTKVFHVKPSHFERRICCSKECQSELFKTKMIGKNNPNYKKALERKINCIYCGNEFKRTSYKDRKTCSKECFLKNLSKIHTGKIIFNKRKRTHITLDKMKCSCGNSKDLKAKTCIDCYKKNIKRKDKVCIICNKIYSPKTNKSKLCSKECQKIHCRNISQWENNPNFKGGIGSKNQIERRSNKFKKWRISVFERDKYTCIDCGKIGGTLHAHHILPFATHKELRFEISNGKTLCMHCHKKYHPSMNFKYKKHNPR